MEMNSRLCFYFTVPPSVKIQNRRLIEYLDPFRISGSSVSLSILVSELARYLQGEAWVGDFFESDFPIRESTLRLNPLDDILYARSRRHAAPSPRERHQLMPRPIPPRTHSTHSLMNEPCSSK